MDTQRGHGPDLIFWDNLGEGFRIQCLCGWITGPGKTVADTGDEFDDHLAYQKVNR